MAQLRIYNHRMWVQLTITCSNVPKHPNRELLVECDYAHRQSVAVLCMPYRIRCKLMHPSLVLYLNRIYIPVRVTRVLWTHIGTVIRIRTLGLLFPCQCLCGTILVTPYSMVWTGGFQEQGQAFLLANLLTCSLPCGRYCLPFSYFILWVGILWAVVFVLIGW